MSDTKMIALTFDDGPDPVYTPLILDLLKQFDAKASFFAVGSELQKFPCLARRIIEEGHELGNHTYSHPDLTTLTYAEIEEELRTTECIIQEVSGKKPKLFRPPYLSNNDMVQDAAQHLGYRMILRSIETCDYRRPGVNKIVEAVLSKLNHGEIVLLHDAGGDRMQTVEAVRVILNELQKRSYRCVRVSELVD